jgi:hypothetical protein
LGVGHYEVTALLLDYKRSVRRLPDAAFFCSLVDLAPSFFDGQDYGHWYLVGTKS